jgi:alkyl hydroperoxide reductase subunit AhpC
MTKIGHPAPHFRAPALVGGNLLLLNSTGLRGRSFTLCFLPPLGLLERAVLEHRVQDFEAEKALFLGVVDEGALFFGPWQKDLWPRGLTLTGDPLGQLSRRFGVSRYQSSARCQSFIVDARGVLRYHLVHELNDQGLNALLEILKSSAFAGHRQASYNGDLVHL